MVIGKTFVLTVNGTYQAGDWFWLKFPIPGGSPDSFGLCLPGQQSSAPCRAGAATFHYGLSVGAANIGHPVQWTFYRHDAKTNTDIAFASGTDPMVATSTIAASYSYGP